MLRLLRIAVILFVFTGCSIAQAAEYTYRQGDKGVEVLFIQIKLREIGYFHDKPDGIFLAKTTQAVKDFQKDYQLKTDGIVDPKTHKILSTAKRKEPLPKKEPPKSKPAGQTNSLVQTAKQYLRVPYKFGGTTSKGFDCSGYVQFVFAKHGKELPRTADLQYKIGKAVYRNQLTPGDVVFFTTYAAGASHNGIYIGDGKFIHASSSQGVMISRLDEAYWKPRYLGARRII